MPKVVLFACVHNAGRSQMSEELFNLNNKNKEYVAMSAGTDPADRPHSVVVEVMREIGINIEDKVPTKLTAELASQAHIMVTMGCGERCPYVPGVKVIEWETEDPKGLPIERVRGIRDSLNEKIKGFIDEACF